MTGGDYVWLASDSLTTNTALTRDILNFFEGLLGLAPLAVSGALNKEFHAFPDRYKRIELNGACEEASHSISSFDVTCCLFPLSWITDTSTLNTRKTLAFPPSSASMLLHGMKRVLLFLLIFFRNPALYLFRMSSQRLFDALNVVRHAVQSSSDWPVDDLAEVGWG